MPAAKPKVKVICKGCGREFEVYQCHALMRKYCGMVCCKKHRSFNRYDGPAVDRTDGKP